MKIGTIILFLLVCSFGLKAQQADLLAIKQSTNNSLKLDFSNEAVSQTSNEYLLLVSGLFLAYKSFISSQDANRCSFHPSCSVYAIRAMKKRGIVVGGLLTFDRLLRCNGLSPEHYELIPKTGLLYDPL